uniref:DNA polymerase alpha subunit B n=1 Tax=Pseudo-nitzschia australis TaxID=44445 RepID=A0A7S4ERB9_9STRA|mmetsp:Transcript_101/g.269  ORF Transcript_101/g.269 Transcript_101/m.269 type:complete len:726 (-) Transcript_101:160-2337(-)
MMAASKVGGDGSRNKKLIKSALVGAGLQTIDSKVLSKCVALASTLNLSPETMGEVWEAHSLNKQNLTELTMHQFEAYKNELIKASSKAPLSDSPPTSSDANSSLGATIVSRKSAIKREAPTATMVTPTSLTKRQKQQSPDVPTSLAHRVAMDGNNVPSPVRSSTSSATTSAMNGKPAANLNLPKYGERTRVGHVVASYRADNESQRDNTNEAKAGRCRCILTTSSDGYSNEDDFGVDVTRHNVTKPYRHMFTTMEDRANALERHLVRMKDAIVGDIETETTNKKNNNGEGLAASFEEVNVPRQDPSTCIGRICNEAHTGRLNATSIVLEGSSSTCGGARVNVDLSHLQAQQQQHQGYSIFPGQIVAVEGMNATGRKITATKLREGAPLLPASTSSSVIRKYYYPDDEQGKQTGPLKVISACGPFTTSNSMEYQPFIDFMHVVMEQKPDVVILMGPFVDVRQESVKLGRMMNEGGGLGPVVDYETIFSQYISGVIEECFESANLQTQFVLVPALEDATAKYVYPQPPLQDRFPMGGKFLDIPGADVIDFGSSGLRRLTKPQKNGKSRVHCLSNPCTFRVNELVFGVTSTDVLFHLSVEETSAHLPVGSRMRRISQHMIQQRSYYPLFPPNKSVNLDIKHQEGWKMPCRPDILMVPSRLTPFCAPIIESTIAVNPGHLAKGTTGGTYAVMEIHPMQREKLDKHEGADNNVMLTHDVQDRIQVEIKRI